MENCLIFSSGNIHWHKQSKIVQVSRNALVPVDSIIYITIRRDTLYFRVKVGILMLRKEFHVQLRMFFSPPYFTQWTWVFNFFSSISCDKKKKTNKSTISEYWSDFHLHYFGQNLTHFSRLTFKVFNCVRFTLKRGKSSYQAQNCRHRHICMVAWLKCVEQ